MSDRLLKGNRYEISILFDLAFRRSLGVYDAKTRGRDNAVAFLWCLGTQLLVTRRVNVICINCHKIR